MKTSEVASHGIPTGPVLGIPISLMPMVDTLALMGRWIEERVPRLIITVDATALVLAKDRPKFREILESADLRTADGVGIVWALKRAGHRDAAKVSGVDIVQRFAQLSAERGYRLYFLGSEPGITDRAAERMRLQFPGCNIVGTHHGYFPAESDSIVAEEIAATNPDVLFVAMGMPRQEEFINSTKHIIQAPINMGVGGSFDVFSGKTKRAPRMIQRLHLEWLWRLILNPTKIAKVKLLPKFVGMVLREPK